MQQASNSLLTLIPFFFTAMLLVRVFPRELARRRSRTLTSFHIDQEGFTEPFPVLLGLPCPPRVLFCSRLGEGSIRSLRTVSLSVLAAVLGLTAVQPAMAGPDITIALKDQVSISASRVLLGQVAEISGDDEERVEQLRNLPIASMPSLGIVLNLDRRQILERISAALPGISDLRISGSMDVRIVLQGRALELNDLIPLIKSHLAAATSWQESEIEIGSIGNLKGIEIPPGDVSLQISERQAQPGARGALLSVEMMLDGKPYRTFWTNVEFQIHAEILQAARQILYGKTITPQDVRTAQVEIRDARIACLRKPEDAVGLVARRTLSPGDPLTRESVTSPLLVRSGETVHLRLERNGIRVVALAQAEQDGKLGQFIRIRNLEFSRPLKARVVGRGAVKVD